MGRRYKGGYGMVKKRKSCQTTGLLPEQRMLSKKRKSKDEKEDGFEKLSNDLIADIVSRVNDDAKFLTQTLTLVNKRFASLISTHITSVSTDINNPAVIKAPYPEFNESSSIDSSIRVHYSLFTTTTNNPPPHPLYTAEFHPLQYCRKIPGGNYFTRKAREKLQRFTGLGNAVIEYPYFDDMFYFGLVDRPMKWKLEYSSDGGIKSCAVLGGNHMKNGSVSSIESEYGNDIYLDVHSRLDWLAMCFKFGNRFRLMVVQMARDHRNLRDITITNNERPRAWIHAGEQELIKMRQQQDEDDDDSCSCSSMHMKVKFWHVPVVELLQGFTFNITAVTFMVATTTSDDDDVDEEKIIREFWGGYHGKQHEMMTQIIQGVENKMKTHVVDNNCIIQIDTIWNWTGLDTTAGTNVL